MTALLRAYVLVAVLLAVGYPGVALLARVRLREAAAWLKLTHGALALALLASVAVAWLPPVPAARPHAGQTWSGRPRGAIATPWVAAPASVGAATARRWPAPGPGTRTGLAVLFAALLAASLARLAWRWRQLGQALARTTEIRRIGRVSVRISDDSAEGGGGAAQGPYSAWWPALLPGQGGVRARAYVVLPLELLCRREDFGIALRHELQHHRSRDTLWAHAWELVRAAFPWHPAAHAWARLTERLQELACDEALLSRGACSPQAYGSCLLRAAQRAACGSAFVPVGTTGMAAGRSGRFLKRRIEMLLLNPRPVRSRSRAWLVVGTLLVTSLMACTAYAARDWLPVSAPASQAHTLTLAEAQRLAERVSASNGAAVGGAGGGIPVVINDRVLRSLNEILGSPAARASFAAGLHRMPLYRAMIEGKLAAAGLPADLIAVPMHESRYRNDVMSPAPYRARGMWQFIEPTARNYGLRIDHRTDQRLDPELETDAGIAYFRDLHAQFGDWWLALKAYNEGEKHVQSLIDRYHTRDVWELERISSSEDYVAGVVATVLLLQSPDAFAPPAEI